MSLFGSLFEFFASETGKNASDKSDTLNMRKISEKALLKIGHYYSVVSEKYGRKGKIAFGVGTIAGVVAVFNFAFSLIGAFIVPLMIGAFGYFGWKIFGAPHLKEFLENEKDRENVR